MPSLDRIPGPHEGFRPFRAAVMRGLGMVIPPLLTLVIFVWVINTTLQYVIEPVNSGAREALIWLCSDQVLDDLTISDPEKRTAQFNGRVYRQIESGEFVPLKVYECVWRNPGSEPLPVTGRGYLRRYVEVTYLRPYYAVPLFLTVFVLLLYLLGKFMAAGIGNIFWGGIERIIHRLPLVRSVYSAVKQVTDFFLSERQIQFTRVVAIEYPRAGCWSLAFITSDGLSDVRTAANEPIVTVFLPTSPVPMGGFTLMVLRREVIDLAISVDQAIQFIVSCGLVIPPQDVERLQKPGADLPEAAAVASGDGLTRQPALQSHPLATETKPSP